MTYEMIDKKALLDGDDPKLAVAREILGINK
jgi:hypothetical protein